MVDRLGKRTKEQFWWQNTCKIVGREASFLSHSFLFALRKEWDKRALSTNSSVSISVAVYYRAVYKLYIVQRWPRCQEVKYRLNNYQHRLFLCFKLTFVTEMKSSSGERDRCGCSNSISGGVVKQSSCSFCFAAFGNVSPSSSAKCLTRLWSLVPWVLFSKVSVSVSLFFDSMVSSKATAIFCKLSTPVRPSHFSFLHQQYKTLFCSYLWLSVEIFDLRHLISTKLIDCNLRSRQLRQKSFLWLVPELSLKIVRCLTDKPSFLTKTLIPASRTWDFCCHSELRRLFPVPCPIVAKVDKIPWSDVQYRSERHYRQEWALNNCRACFDL